MRTRWLHKSSELQPRRLRSHATINDHNGCISGEQQKLGAWLQTRFPYATITPSTADQVRPTSTLMARALRTIPVTMWIGRAATGLLVYNKDNLHWASASEQSLNKSTHRTNAHAKPVWVRPLNGVWTAHLSAAAAKKAHPGISISRIKRVANRNLADACEKHEIKGHVCVWGTRESQEDLECGDDSNLPSPPPSNLPEDKRSAGPSMEKEP